MWVLVWKRTMAKPTTIKAIMATTLIVENQLSNSPNSPTLTMLTSINKTTITSGPTHCGRLGNQYLR